MKKNTNLCIVNSVFGVSWLLIIILHCVKRSKYGCHGIPNSIQEYVTIRADSGHSLNTGVNRAVSVYVIQDRSRIFVNGISRFSRIHLQSINAIACTNTGKLHGPYIYSAPNIQDVHGYGMIVLPEYINIKNVFAVHESGKILLPG